MTARPEAALSGKECESCGNLFELLRGRGSNNRIMCYTCLPVNSGDKLLSYRNKHMKRQYGITLFRYRKLYEEQQHCCIICKSPVDFDGSDLKKGEHRLPTQPCIDHCHTTGRVRGILCFHCNTALGHVNDDPLILKRMIDYLGKD